MRLLHVDTYKLEEFFGDKIPKYTILSHTWGEEEVSFADLDSPNVKEQEGWKKIKYICKETGYEGGGELLLGRHLLHRQVKQHRALRSNQ
jgi:hypothetical protein